ncbi:MAG: putative metalloprotease CJM1_0395 family protein [Myxococcota bacterium]
MIGSTPGRGRLDIARRLDFQDAQRARNDEQRRVPGSEVQVRRDEAAAEVEVGDDRRVRGVDGSEQSARARYMESGLGMPQREMPGERVGAVDVAPLRLPGTPSEGESPELRLPGTPGETAEADAPRLPGTPDSQRPAPEGLAARTPVDGPSPTPEAGAPLAPPTTTEATEVVEGAEAEERGSEPPAGTEELSDAEERRVQELKQRDSEVRRHEMAHVVAGGPYTGAPSYEFERGPDGRAYAVAGSVPVDVSPVPGDPQETIEKMRQVKRAALAPAEPSSADRRVAAQADQAAAKARVELRQQRVDEAEVRAAQAEAQTSGEGLEVGAGEPRGARATVMTFQALRAYGSQQLQQERGVLETERGTLESGAEVLEAPTTTLRTERQTVRVRAPLETPREAAIAAPAELPAPRPAPTPSATADGSLGQPDG